MYKYSKILHTLRLELTEKRINAKDKIIAELQPIIEALKK